MTNRHGRAALLDAAVTAAGSVLIGAFAHRLPVMSVAIPILLAARMIAWARLPASEREHGFGAEAALYAACVVIGAANDWNTVVRHGVYEYTVPSDLGAFSSIPAWMLLFWGQILRSLASLSRWTRLGPDTSPKSLRVWRGAQIGGRAARLAFILLVTIATRQAIYRFHLHPIWSWLPFSLALAVYVFAMRPSLRHLRVASLLVVAGPAVEAIFIRVVGLHRYDLGWLFGVPLWIVLWWALAAMILAELTQWFEDTVSRET
ncbi:hypothetical protein K8I61_12380 [bacterium]|nr:hypothetical protein [bacterium]